VHDINYDVAIIGGGAAGSAAALTLLKQGVSSLCIIEPSDFSNVRIGDTIPPDTNLLLSELGVRDAFLSQGHLPAYGSHSLWGSARLGHNDFLTSPFGHGWHLDRKAFDKMLLDEAVKRGAVRIKQSCRAVNITANSIESVTVGDDTVRAIFYIDATGRKSVLLRSLGVPHHYDDKQLVIWARFRVSQNDLGHSTWLEATANGWWYAAELPNQEAIVAFGTSPRLAKSRGLHGIKKWATALSHTDLIAPKLMRAKILQDSFRVTASHSYIMKDVQGPNWLAIGDAASAFDPLSSAGIYKALLTGKMAANAIINDNMYSYAQTIQQDYAAYIIKNNELYKSEQRWPSSDFWSARHKSE